jgi:signal transduction histidine kinase
MARIDFSITRGIALVVIALHAIVLPVLYYGLSLVVSHSHSDVFIQHVRTLSRNIADELELGDSLESPRRLADVLDLAILNGDGVYAELLDNGHTIRSDLSANNVHWPGHQDYGFTRGGSGIYFIELPILRPGHAAELRLGFDEVPTIEQIHLAMRHTIWALSAYLCVAVAVAVGAGYWMARPVVQLKQIARRIASGDYIQSLRLRTRFRELNELGSDLDNMRNELVGVNERLRAENRERAAAEGRQRQLEIRLRHRQRLETVGTLAGGIAHEFNNVLLPIVLATELAIADAADESAVRLDLEDVLSSAYRAKDVVQKILTFSRDAGVPVLEWIDLEPVIHEALRLFGALIPATVDLRTDIAGPCPPVKADAALAIQLIMNICTNAYQALRGGQGVLTLSLATRPAPGPGPGPDGMSASSDDYVVLSIADTGHGMDAGTKERIFEPFFTTREVGGGTGLGLSVVHGIAESFGASIVVDSTPDLGTTFHIFFPVGPKPSAEERLSQTHEGANT